MNFEEYLKILKKLKTKTQKKQFIEQTDTQILVELFQELEKRYYENKIYMQDICYDEFIILLQNKMKTKIIKLDRVYSEQDLLTKLSKFDDMLCITPKLDGISVTMVNGEEDPTDLKLFLKGQTKQRDISEFLTLLPINTSTIVKFIKKYKITNLKIKGELIKPIDKLQTKNGRSEVNGIIKRKNITKKDLENITIIFYELSYVSKEIKDSINQKIQLKLINKLKLNTPIFQTILKKNFKFDETFLLYRKFTYETDGFVIKDQRNNAIAFKYTSDTHKVTITDIEWVKNKNKFTPILHFDKIVIENVNVKKVTGSNAKKVITNQMGIGSVIEIAYKGSTTTIIVKVIKPSSNFNFPQNYKFDDNNINIMPCSIEMFSSLELDSFFKLFYITNFSKLRINQLLDLINEKQDSLDSDTDKNNIMFWIDSFIKLLTNYDIFGQKLDKDLLDLLKKIKSTPVPYINFLAWLPTKNQSNISLRILKSLTEKIKIDSLLSLQNEEEIDKLLSDNDIKGQKAIILKDKLLLFKKMNYQNIFNFIYQ